MPNGTGKATARRMAELRIKGSARCPACNHPPTLCEIVNGDVNGICENPDDDMKIIYACDNDICAVDFFYIYWLQKS